MKKSTTTHEDRPAALALVSTWSGLLDHLGLDLTDLDTAFTMILSALEDGAVCKMLEDRGHTQLEIESVHADILNYLR
jgi:hypothetical protein